jgi:heme/copper-type cytochrome/quinol oxidase subunit 4
MKEMETVIQMLPYMIPLIILEVVLTVVALIDLAKRKHVTGGNKIIWVLVTVCIQIIGPVVYLIAGRKEESVDCD